jgi:hypothetical protein
MICDSKTFVSYSQFLEQVKWVFSRLQSNLPLAAGVYTLTALIVFYNYVIDTNIVFHTLGIHSRNNVPVQYKTSPESNAYFWNNIMSVTSSDEQLWRS